MNEDVVQAAAERIVFAVMGEHLEAYANDPDDIRRRYEKLKSTPGNLSMYMAALKARSEFVAAVIREVIAAHDASSFDPFCDDSEEEDAGCTMGERCLCPHINHSSDDCYDVETAEAWAEVEGPLTPLSPPPDPRND